MRALFSPSARSQILGAGTGIGTAFSNGNAVKGSYATLGTATFSADAIGLQWVWAGRRGRIDIAVNTGGADTVIAADIPYSSFAANVVGGNILLPVKIPAGAVIKARALGNAAAVTLNMLAQIYSFSPGNRPSGGRVISLTDWSGSTPFADPANTVTTTGQSLTAWTTIMASTPAPVTRLWAVPLDAGDVSRTGGAFLVDIGIGSAGNEIVLGRFQGNNPTNAMNWYAWELPGSIPAGSRLAFRVQHSQAGSADTFGVGAIGLVA